MKTSVALIGFMGNLEIADELLKRHADIDGASQGLQMAQKSAHDLLDMVNSLLDINILEAGKPALEYVPISLPHMAEGVI